MKANKFFVEWKSKNGKDKHAWIVDTKEGKEAPICDPTRIHKYLNPLLRVEFTKGKYCKACKRKLVGFAEKFPTIQVMKEYSYE